MNYLLFAFQNYLRQAYDTDTILSMTLLFLSILRPETNINGCGTSKQSFLEAIITSKQQVMLSRTLSTIKFVEMLCAALSRF